MRGEHLAREHRAVEPHGIIPACAGSTAICAWTALSAGDHPRMRGEHVAGILAKNVLGGIIPACAGSTFEDWCIANIDRGSSPHARGALTDSHGACLTLRDHPRMRGEHAPVTGATYTATGIIPACAGSTTPRRDGRGNGQGSSPHARGAPNLDLEVLESAQDHPRMRGEHAELHDCG